MSSQTVQQRSCKFQDKWQWQSLPVKNLHICEDVVKKLKIAHRKHMWPPFSYIQCGEQPGFLKETQLQNFSLQCQSSLFIWLWNKEGKWNLTRCMRYCGDKLMIKIMISKCTYSSTAVEGSSITSHALICAERDRWGLNQDTKNTNWPKQKGS